MSESDKRGLSALFMVVNVLLTDLLRTLKSI